ncbi:MAG TPA: hypothetical protein VH120_01740 [Gemmataceae bacterium]|nr:hypothetical protein [Gemmataceae bacterium]
MKRFILFLAAGIGLCFWSGGDVNGRGFGGFRGGYGGGFHYGGGSSFGGGGYHYGGDRFGGSYSGYHSGGGYSFGRSGGYSGSYDRSYDTARGGSISTSGTRGAVYGPRGAAAGGTRDTDITTAGGKTYSGASERGVAVGPYGRTVGGSTGSFATSGTRGTAAGGWQSAFARTRFPTDAGLAHYSGFGTMNGAHSTAYWSHGSMANTGDYVRHGFGYYHCFYPDWYRRYPNYWYAAGWAAGAAWATATWAVLDSYIGVGSEPAYTYDYGSNIVYQNNNVYVAGTDAGTAQQYSQEATNLAVTGQTADAQPTADWKPLGVYALVPGDQKTSNNLFQLAVDKAGIIRGNYYDGVMDTTTPVFGSVDKKTQRAAWTIGKTKDRVFEAGLWNLTQSEAPVLVHMGADKTQQWLLVRVEQPANQPTGGK